MTRPLTALQPLWLYRDGRCVGVRFNCPCGGHCIFSPVTIFFHNPVEGGDAEGPETMRRTRVGARFAELTLEPPIVLPGHWRFVVREGNVIDVG